MKSVLIAIGVLFAALIQPLRAEEYDTLKFPCSSYQAATVIETVQRLGIPFPTNTFIQYDSADRGMIVHHTPLVAQSIARILGRSDAVQVEIDTTFIALPQQDIAAICRTNPAGMADAAAVQALWRSGKGRLLATTKLVTPSGANANSQSVRDIKDRDLSIDPLALNEFETREVGTVVNVTPTTSPDRTCIDLAIALEHSELAERLPGSMTTSNSTVRTFGTAMARPDFACWQLQTNWLLENGETTVFGLGPHSRTGELVYVFLTARILSAPDWRQP